MLPKTLMITLFLSQSFAVATLLSLAYTTIASARAEQSGKVIQCSNCSKISLLSASFSCKFSLYMGPDRCNPCGQHGSIYGVAVHTQNLLSGGALDEASCMLVYQCQAHLVCIRKMNHLCVRVKCFTKYYKGYTEQAVSCNQQ